MAKNNMDTSLGETSSFAPPTDKQGTPIKAGQHPMLVVMHGSLLGKTYAITEKSISIGRKSNREVCIEDENVSRKHAEIFIEDGCVKLRDLESTNGTFVNSQRVSETNLNDGDLILVGKVLFKYVCSTSIESQFFGQMYALATTDFLTGSFNRQHLLSRLEQEYSRARRYGRFLSIVLYDIDHFKQINEDFGHLAGDQLLMESSRLVAKNVRQDDLFGRYGADEFMIICPETDLQDTVALAQRISQIVGKWSYSYQSRKFDFSISMGVATLTDEMRSVVDLIAKAEGHLHRAKHKGRNKVSA